MSLQASTYKFTLLQTQMNARLCRARTMVIAPTLLLNLSVTVGRDMKEFCVKSVRANPPGITGLGFDVWLVMVTVSSPGPACYIFPLYMHLNTHYSLHYFHNQKPKGLPHNGEFVIVQ